MFMKIAVRGKTVLLLGLGVLFLSPRASYAACDQTLSVGADVAAAVASAANGSTICLNGGNYGSVNFTNLNRSGFVTVRSTSGISAQMSIGQIYQSKFIKFENMTFGQVTVRECSSDIEFWNSVWQP